MDNISLSKKFEMEMLFRAVDSVSNLDELKKLTKDIIRQNFEIKHLIGQIGKIDLDNIMDSLEEK